MDLEPEGYGTSSSYMAVYALKDAIERAGYSQFRCSCSGP